MRVGEFEKIDKLLILKLPIMIRIEGLFSIFLLILGARSLTPNKITPPPRQQRYEYFFEVTRRTTMTVWSGDRAPPLVFNQSNGRYYERNYTNDTPCDKLEETKWAHDDVITVDGSYHVVLAINGQLPGPTIVVYQNSELVVVVANKYDKPITIHWHGLDQRGTFFYDGVGMLTQCPINPGATFTFRINVTDHPGTYWYHGHVGTQPYGLFGGLIVLDPNDAAKANETDDFLALLSDFYPKDEDAYFNDIRNDNTKFMPGYASLNECYYWTRDVAGQGSGIIQFHSLLVNARGWANINEITDKSWRVLPLERFSADVRRRQRFHLINVGIGFALSFSVAGHRLRVLQSDGQPIRIITVDYVIVQPGERYLVELQAVQPVSAVHEIEIRTLERFSWTMAELSDIDARKASAFLQFIDTPGASPVWESPTRQCTRFQPCVVANCPFERYPVGFNRTCMTVGDFEAIDRLPASIATPNVHEFFLNIRFQSNIHSINGIEMMMPSHPPFLIPNGVTPCDFDRCGLKQKCHCTHQLNVTLGDVVQLVIYNKGYPENIEPPASARTAFGHSVHLHGQHFYVVRQGWPSYDPQGIADMDEREVNCDGHFWCDRGSWTNRSMPAGNLFSPAYKDTLYVPFGGYAVLRFKADNPGWWLLHCHSAPHMIDGLALVLRVGEGAAIPTPPGDFPTCGVPLSEVSSHLRRDSGVAIGATTTKEPEFSVQNTSGTKQLSAGELGIIVGFSSFIGGMLLGAIVTYAITQKYMRPRGVPKVSPSSYDPRRVAPYEGVVLPLSWQQYY